MKSQVSVPWISIKTFLIDGRTIHLGDESLLIAHI